MDLKFEISNDRLILKFDLNINLSARIGLYSLSPQREFTLRIKPPHLLPGTSKNSFCSEYLFLNLKD
ncbi:hypothetical protein BpHYR1_005907 [Brachionus plicatilis]|uniref:Uncharacterized protein n=1 Tax=Brachionus plicatilis TaxID=10195 RepID=A0A3M7PT63_BRAPC|nr:hypothetical protein BpHYR1_005907 [Brachionus plicatilis]